MMRELTALWSSLSDSEYLHLLLEPVPLFGLGFGLIFLIASVLLGEKKTRLLALLLMALSCASVQPYVSLRTKSQPRIIALHDGSYHQLIIEQSTRRSSSAWLYYSIAAWCLIALVLGKGDKGVVVIAITVIICSAGFLHALWLHKKECEVFHRNTVKYTPIR